MPPIAKNLTLLEGISTITACTIYTETKGKISTKEKFASYCGVAPVDCSSGKTTRKRNNKGGNHLFSVRAGVRVFSYLPLPFEREGWGEGDKIVKLKQIKYFGNIP